MATILLQLQRERECTDTELLSAFVQSCSQVAFAELVRRHGPMVMGVCRRIVPDCHVAEDAFQAAFLVLARRAASVKPTETLGGWLYATATRTSWKARAKYLRLRSREQNVDPFPERAISDAIHDDTAKILDEELSALPERWRVPLLLCDLQGMPQRQVAGQLGIAVSSLAGRLGTARKRLADKLTARGVTLSGFTLTAAIAPQTSQQLAAAAAILAAGGVPVGIATTSALQLSEGIMPMLFATKMKVTVVVLVATAMITLGFGSTILPILVAAGDPPAAAVKPAIGPNLSDEDFLKRMCLDLRGTPATTAELGYFLADKDGNKRKKVVEWLTNPRPDRVSFLPHQHGAELKKDSAKKPESGEYRIQPPDVIRYTISAKNPVTKTRVPETIKLSGDWPIRVDGTMYLEEWGNPKVGGMTIPEAEKAIVESFKERGLMDVSVRLESQESPLDGYFTIRKIGLNEQNHLGNYLAKNVTVIDAIGLVSKSGSKLDDISSVYIERREKIGETCLVLPVDWVGITRHGETRTNYQMRGGDILHIRCKIEPLFIKLYHQHEYSGYNCNDCHSGFAKSASFQELHTPNIDISRILDERFLQSICQEARGSAATRIEEEYFIADRDPARRAKFVEFLLLDPAIFKKVGPGWRETVLRKPGESVTGQIKQPALLDQILDGKRSPEAVADLVFVSCVGRLPTESERALTLAQVAKSTDPKKAWREVQTTLLQTLIAK
ncbi:MAG: sigma-70 family RNA polymerase sigma factor [Fimbriiglobus sp.]